jgi:competence protein ComEA
MRAWIKQVYFTQRELHGLRILWSLLIFIWILTVTLPKWLPWLPLASVHPSELNIETTLINLDSMQAAYKASFYHNPWGIPDYMATRIEKYLQAGGKLEKGKDLDRIFGMEPGFKETLLPQLPLRASKGKDRNEQGQSKQEILMDINKADTLQLVQLRFIGAKRAKRITDYRDKLGGFLDTTQYKEVWGLDSASLLSLFMFTYIDSTFTPKKLNVNTADWRQLMAHPYVGYYAATQMDSYRKNHGRIPDWETLLNFQGIKREKLGYMKRYLEL